MAMSEPLTVDQALEMFNRIAEERGAKTRKQFRNRATAEAAFQSLNLPDPDWGDGKPTKVSKSKSKGAAPKAVTTIKSVSAAKPGRRKPKANGAERHVISKDEDTLLAAFQALNGSNHAKVLARLEKAGGKPVALADLQKETGQEKSAIMMTIGGLIKKTEGESLRGKPRPKYKIIKTRNDDKELYIALQAE
jgi:hypothetical protein